MPVPIAHVPAKDRPRERLSRLGAVALSDAELLALLLRSGVPGCNAVHLAEDLLAEHGGLAALAAAPADAVARARGVGDAKAASLVAAFEIGRRMGRDDPARGAVIGDAADVAAAVRPFLREEGREECLVVVVGARNRLVRVEPLTIGTATSALLEPSDVLGVVFRHGGSGFALVHTHPSGELNPSAEDVTATRRVREAAEAARLRFLDHVIVAGRRWASIATPFG